MNMLFYNFYFYQNVFDSICIVPANMHWIKAHRKYLMYQNPKLDFLEIWVPLTYDRRSN